MPADSFDAIVIGAGPAGEVCSGRLGGAQESLGRHATVERALTADQMAFDHGHAQPRLAEPARADLAGRPGADHDRVEDLGVTRPRHTP